MREEEKIRNRRIGKRFNRMEEVLGLAYAAYDMAVRQFGKQEGDARLATVYFNDADGRERYYDLRMLLPSKMLTVNDRNYRKLDFGSDDNDILALSIIVEKLIEKGIDDGLEFKKVDYLGD